MRKFHDTFETIKQSFITAFSICMAVLLIETTRQLFYLMCGWHKNLAAKIL